jgi:hypothetical protein
MPNGMRWVGLDVQRMRVPWRSSTMSLARWSRAALSADRSKCLTCCASCRDHCGRSMRRVRPATSWCGGRGRRGSRCRDQACALKRFPPEADPVSLPLTPAPVTFEFDRHLLLRDVPGFGAVRTQTPAAASRACAAPGGSRKGRPGPGSDRPKRIACVSARLRPARGRNPAADHVRRNDRKPTGEQSSCTPHVFVAHCEQPAYCVLASASRTETSNCQRHMRGPRKQGRDRAGAAARDGGRGFCPGVPEDDYVSSGASRLRQTTMKGRFGGSPAWRRSTWPSVIQISRPTKTSDVG